MKKIKLQLGALLFLLCFACTDSDDYNEKKIQNEVKSMFAAYVQQVNTKGIEGIGTYFSDDPQFHWVEDGLLQYPTKNSLVTGIEEFFPSISTIDLRTTKVEVTVINKELTSLYAEYKEDVALVSGYSFTLDGAMTILTRKENGQWKFLVGHSSIKKPRGGN